MTARPAPPPFHVEVLSDETAGTGGFLHIRRLRLRNVHPDGSSSRTYLCDFVERPGGLDAVVLAIFRRGDGGVEVLLREGLRPALLHGRSPARVPIEEGQRSLLLTEVVAGVIEEGEVGEEAVRRRASDEAMEEAGLHVPPGSVVILGGSFPSPGMTPERFWLTAAEVSLEASTASARPEGDGSPMEEGARISWVALDEAIARCVRGEIEDAKTELVLRRLRDRI